MALGLEKQVSVFGNDYPTGDGSCIRDYIHVVDIARAHILPLENLDRGKFNKAYNIGNGNGFSVLEVIEMARKVTDSPIPAVINPRREGDPAVLVLDEPTASLDAEAEYEVFRRFGELTAGRIAVLISHRFSTVRMADRIVVIEGGHITEVGGHQELLARGGPTSGFLTCRRRDTDER